MGRGEFGKYEIKKERMKDDRKEEAKKRKREERGKKCGRNEEDREKGIKISKEGRKEDGKGGII